MTETSNLSLPLLQPSQAQKHVTVNEALVRLDALSALVLLSRSLPSPPEGVADGSCYALPASASGLWAGQGGRVAIFVNGGWIFVDPRRGWRAWIEDEHVLALYDGASWRGGAIALSVGGAGSFFKVKEFDHTIMPGERSITTGVIPANVMVFAVTARVLEPIAGALDSWQLGTESAEDRFGSGLGLSSGSFARGLLSSPMTYYEAAPLVLTPVAGDFMAGAVRIAVHYYEPSIP